MWIVIFGTKKLHTGTQYLEFAQSGDKFEPGSVKTFSFDAPDVNEVKRIKVQTVGYAVFQMSLQSCIYKVGNHTLFLAGLRLKIFVSNLTSFLC